jgi:hypothetical protein
MGGLLTVVSMKFNRTPLLHTRLDFRQFKQFGRASSHFKCRSRQVKHPVRTLLGLLVAARAAGASASPPAGPLPGICVEFFRSFLASFTGAVMRCRLVGRGLRSPM